MNLCTAFADEVFGLCDGHLTNDIITGAECSVLGQVDDFERAERLGDFDGDGVGIHSEGTTFAIKTEGRHDGDDAVVEEELQRVGVDAFDFASVELVDSADDACGVGDDAVCVGGTEVDGGEPLHEFVQDVVGGFDGEAQGRIVCDACSVPTRDGDVPFCGELLNLSAGSVDEDNFDAEGSQDGDVEQQVGQVG